MPEIFYTLKRSARSRNLRIQIKPNGDVVVSAPPRVGQWQVDTFVHEQADWIGRMKAKVLAHKVNTNPDEVQIFGKKYQKEIDSTGTKIGVKIQGSKIIITPVSGTTASVEKALSTFFKATAEKYILPRTKQLGIKMKTSYGRVTLREQQTRWGSCSSEGNLNFNWRLVHDPPAVIDYVIIHELAHRTHMDHSRAFWDLVAKYDPEYLKHRGWLKRQGMALG